jgi:hypothetical protein
MLSGPRERIATKDESKHPDKVSPAMPLQGILPTPLALAFVMPIVTEQHNRQRLRTIYIVNGVQSHDCGLSSLLSIVAFSVQFTITDCAS